MTDIYSEFTENGSENEEDAYRLLFNWKDCAAEGEKEYFERIRKIKLLRTMKKIIENELDDNQKAILRMKHFDGKSYEKIGRELSLSPSAVLRSCKRAEGIIASFMKYAFVFSDLKSTDTDKPLDVKSAISLIMLEHADKYDIAARMRKSRSEKFISVEKAALCTGIDKNRITSLEQTGILSVSEMKRLVSFYGVSADYIIFGAE